MTIQECIASSGLVFEAPLMREVVVLVERAAASRAGVLICGEAGTGRGLVARTLHACAPADASSPGAVAAPFVVIDGAALPPSEAERLIFGTAAGSPSGGAGRRARAREIVHRGSLLHDALGGTVFFRHLEELPARVQTRLAVVFRDREILERAHGEILKYTARAVAAADPDWPSQVDAGRVRLDLSRRFAEFRIALPALRDRREDIPGLARHFAAEACRSRGTALKALDAGALSVLAAMPWHGNSRELRDVVDALVRATSDDTISLQTLLDHVSLDGSSSRPLGSGESLRQARQRFEREFIAAVVAQHRGRIPDAAVALGIQRTNLYRKLRALRLDRTAYEVVPRAGGRIR